MIDIDKERREFAAWANGEAPHIVIEGVSLEWTDAKSALAGWLAARAAIPPSTENSVPVPKDANQAHLMANLGLLWLKDHAPERLIGAGDAIPSTGVAAGVSEQAADSARLDWLEQRGNDGGLLLHAGNQDTGRRSGLGLVNTGRTLRQAVDSARGVKVGAPATPQTAPSQAKEPK